MQARRSAPGAYMPRMREQSTPLTPNLQKLQSQQPTADSYIIASLSSSQHRPPSHSQSILESNIPGRSVPTTRTTCANHRSEKDRPWQPVVVKQGRWVRNQIQISRSHHAGSSELRSRSADIIAASGSVLQSFSRAGVSMIIVAVRGVACVPRIEGNAK